jgi:hypothetical protein
MSRLFGDHNKHAMSGKSVVENLVAETSVDADVTEEDWSATRKQ